MTSSVTGFSPLYISLLTTAEGRRARVCVRPMEKFSATPEPADRCFKVYFWSFSEGNVKANKRGQSSDGSSRLVLYCACTVNNVCKVNIILCCTVHHTQHNATLLHSREYCNNGCRSPPTEYSSTHPDLSKCV